MEYSDRYFIKSLVAYAWSCKHTFRVAVFFLSTGGLFVATKSLILKTDCGIEKLKSPRD